MKLRWYQNDAVTAVYDHLEQREDNPCVVMPTGAGKSPTIAKIAMDVTKRWGGRCLVVAHRKELLEQNAEKLWLFDKTLDVGIYSAGLKRRDTGNAIIVGGIQSIYNKVAQLGAFSLALIDEAHLIPPNSESMYQQLVADLREASPGIRFIGFTATPYRMKGGSVCKRDWVLNEVCYEVKINALMAQGFLAKCVSYSGSKEGQIDTDNVGVRGGEFIQGQIELKALVDGRVAAAVDDILEKTKGREKVLIFSCSVRHCQDVVLELNRKIKEGQPAAQMVVGETPGPERDELIRQFRKGKFKFLVNVEVLTMGFDVPDVDCVVMLRPTRSPGLYVQMVGRGFRVTEKKADCLVLDYGGNVLRHGPIDQVTGQEPSKKKGKAPSKECPDCGALIAFSYQTCPQCGHRFPEVKPEPRHDTKAHDGSLVGGPPAEWMNVQRTEYDVHTKYGAPADHPKTVKVTYIAGLYTVSEWLCVEHEGYPRRKAMKWWGARQKVGSKIPCPECAFEAVDILQADRMRHAGRVLVAQGIGRGNYDRVIDHELYMYDGKTLLSDIQRDVNAPSTTTDDEVPF